jgi:hypothetical protein
MAEIEENGPAALTAEKKFEVEVNPLDGIIKKPKERLSIEKYDFTKEAGGVILGYVACGSDHRVSEVQPVRLVQMKNTAKKPTRFRMPGIIGILLPVFHKAKLSEIYKGMQVIGEWHSDFYGKLEFSKHDMDTIFKRAKMFGIWICGVMIRTHGNFGKMKMKPFVYNNRTIFKRKRI